MLSDFTNKELFHLAIDAANQKRADATLTYLKELVSREPDHNSALFLLGATYATLGMFEEAVEHLDKTVKDKPDFYIARFQLGLSLLALDLSTEGCLQFEHILSTEAPEFLKCFSEGLLHSQRNQKEKAIEILERGIQLAPKNPISHDMEGVIDALKNMPEEALLSSEPVTNEKSSISVSSSSLSSNDFLLGAYRQ